MITKTTKDLKEELERVLAASGQFDADSIAYTLDTLDKHLENPDYEIWSIHTNEQEEFRELYKVAYKHCPKTIDTFKAGYKGTANNNEITKRN
ncbi:hypothetical protein [Paraferrimonas haliotis]|uniref:Uncharacterized protein n=1 Tax=Paraferrimonas haliotis TaxID=2013866 RepID=A0AA37TRS9_9GAMM|nr:hypothetical protein [Paraferrimonas haliotis]GLS84548.1 hypothetical protein GCM10007894_25250 [Paraferrimonas haliotis]